MASNWQITLRIIWYHIRKDGTGALMILLLIAVIIAVFWRLGERITSPIVAETHVNGRIETVLIIDTDTTMGTARGYSYRYGVRLDENNNLIFASKSAKQPKQIGENVTLVRANRENGLATYRFVEGKADGN